MIPQNLVLTTLAKNPEYFKEVILLIEEEFHYSEGLQYEIDFAPLVNPLNFENCYLYIDQSTNAVVAHLAVCEKVLIKNGTKINAFFIGGIATQKEYRKQNLFKSLMNHALEVHADNAGLFILWSDLENLYEKFSFYRTGGLLETGKRNFSASERPTGYEKTKFSELSETDFERVADLYKDFNEKHFFTVKREAKDWSIIRTMTSIDLYIKRHLGTIDRYFCVNKGRDLTNIIHEISCKEEEFLKTLNELKTFKTWLPETELQKLPESEVYYTAFIKLGSVEKLNAFLKGATKGSIIIESMDNLKVYFTYINKEYEASRKDFMQYLFGPKPLKEFADFNLSLYIAGTDSI
jgi:predicted N-acetyltransferase YhbS